jgi:hypothetical protein
MDAAAIGEHAQVVQRPVGGRKNERHRLVERPVLPEETIEIGAVVPTEARPQDEQVIARDDVRRIELEIADVRRRLENRSRRRSGDAIETLRTDREAARLREGDAVLYAELLSASEGASEAFRGLARSAIRAPMRRGPAGVSPGRARGSSR